MQTTITARHCEISDALRERALDRRASGWATCAPRPIEIDRRVRHRRHRRPTAELRLHAGAGRAPGGQRRGGRSPHRAGPRRGEAPPPAGEARGPASPRRAHAQPDDRADAPTPRLPLPPRRSAPARGAHRRARAGPPDARGRGGEPGAGAGRLHRALRAQPAPRVRRNRDHLPQLARRRGAAGNRWTSSSASTCPASS